MSQNPDIRWKQRYQNFSKSFDLLNTALECDIEALKDLEAMGLVQAFEMSFELAWKTLKDFLEYQGYDVKSPRETIREAFKQGYLPDAESWLNCLEGRNSTLHAYDKDMATQVMTAIRDTYHPMLRAFSDFAQSQLEDV